ncbi:nucleoside phosphorylase [Haloplanus salilacus]|uniref:nucleoside phosphorylase n=1 Tax=Haloplanus salilacus TaxID=2949994 RepID=UPI0030CC601D
MTDFDERQDSPLFEAKRFGEPSVFTPDSLLSEARRQKDLPDDDVPDVCVLDPDGDIVRQLVATGRGEKDGTWPGYHTDLYRFSLDGDEVGIVGRAVGAPFAVLVAEQLFASGCQFLVSITSSGRIVPKDDPPYFVLIDRALRDERASHHYESPAQYATLPADLQERVETACQSVPRPVYTGATWTTDAPFRETEAAIQRARDEGILAVEMEAAALYTFAAQRGCPVVCFAYVTNEMGQGDSEFEKGDANGSKATLEIIDAAITAWESGRRDPRSASGSPRDQI